MDENDSLENEAFTQEAFTPVFTIAPEVAPPQDSSNGHIPTTEEQAAAAESIYKKLGVKAKEILEAEPVELTPELAARVNRTSLMAARIFTSVCMWGWSIFGIEYQIVAPTVDHSQRMIEPILRITARHSKFIGNVSPDVDDLIEAGTAMSDYALYAISMMQQIREDKLANANNGRYNGTIRTGAYQAQFNGANSGPNDFRGPSPSSYEPSQDARNEQHTNTTGDLTADQQYNRDQLHTLSVRDMQYRAKRSGRL